MSELPGRVFRKWPTGFEEPNFKKKDTEIKKEKGITPENLTLGKLIEMLEKKEISEKDIKRIRRWQEMAVGKEISPEEFRKRIKELLKERKKSEK